MDTALIDSLAWALIFGIWIFVGFGVRHSLRDLGRLSRGGLNTLAWHRAAPGSLAYA